MTNNNYTESPFYYQRFQSSEVIVGNIGIGGKNPIRIQSMTNTDTMNTEATAAQAIQLFRNGSELVRITIPGKKEAENLKKIRKKIKEQGLRVPIVADVHFAPAIALLALENADKVRINPGNFADRRHFRKKEYSDSEYREELERVHDTFRPFILRAKTLGIPIRIGTNHGSLSDRILNRFGDTPEGMVESTLEFIRMAEEHSFHDMVISLKASNARIMVRAYRLLIERFGKYGMKYPLHLGVTEAGYDQDGRIKSIIGIGTLLEDGIGDTIRVSLTENPIAELPVARKIADRYNSSPIQKSPHKRKTNLPDKNLQESYRLKNVIKNNPLRVMDRISHLNQKTPDEIFQEIERKQKLGCDLFLFENIQQKRDKFLKLLNILTELQKRSIVLECNIESLISQQEELNAAGISAFSVQIDLSSPATEITMALSIFDNFFRQTNVQIFINLFIPTGDAIAEETRIDDFLSKLSNLNNIRRDKCTLSLQNRNIEWNINTSATRPTALNRFLSALIRKIENPDNRGNFTILIRLESQSQEDAIYSFALHAGGLLLDGIGDVLYSYLSLQENQDSVNQDFALKISLDILHNLRIRKLRTEFISCPSCGRTLFDIETTAARIKSRLGHLKGVTIAIMGCIVNGPGEMADADFGYVGGGPGKIHLYRKHEIVKSNISSEKAEDELIELIKNEGMWSEK